MKPEVSCHYPEYFNFLDSCGIMVMKSICIWRILMKCGKLFLLSAVSFAMGALVYKAVRDNKEELDKFVDDYGDFVDDDVLEAELIEEE
jgi:hypothetical protein